MMRALAIGFFFLCFAPQLFACQCTVLPALTKAEAEKYDIVFEGQIIAVSPSEEADGSRARFKITALYKGQAYTNIDVAYSVDGDCGLDFAPGQTWIIYGNYISYGVPKADWCLHSRRKPDSGQQDYYAIDGRASYTDELKWLNDSLGVQPFINPEDHKDLHHKNILPDPTQAIVYSMAGLVGLLAIFIFVRRLFRKK